MRRSARATGSCRRRSPVGPERGELKSCIVDGDNVSERMLVFNEQLAQPYQDDSQLVIEEPLAKAGTRLVLLLNQNLAVGAAVDRARPRELAPGRGGLRPAVKPAIFSRSTQQRRLAMAAHIPEKFRDLVSTKKTFAHLATVSPGGQPQVTPVWIDADGDLILVNSAKGRVKDRNMRKNALVALSILDPDNPYRHLAVRGRVVAVTQDGAEEHIDRLAKKYLGLDRYPNRKPGEERVIYKIEPLRVATME